MDEVDEIRLDASGKPENWNAVVERHAPRLRRLVAFRLDERIKARVDPSDVVQDALAEAVIRISEYVANPQVPFFLWLRFLTRQRLGQVHRHHLGRELRDANRDVPLRPVGTDGSSSMAIASCLAANQTPSSQIYARGEMTMRLADALEQMDPIDREILALRHFEGLSNQEAADIMEMTVSAASKRYVRALEKIRTILGDSSSTNQFGTG